MKRFQKIFTGLAQHIFFKHAMFATIKQYRSRLSDNLPGMHSENEDLQNVWFLNS